MTELARSDRRVRELADLLGQLQSLVSYHLGEPGAVGLVSVRRSSASRRDAYYRVELTRCGELASQPGGALHPGLELDGFGGPPVPSALVRQLCVDGGLLLGLQ